MHDSDVFISYARRASFAAADDLRRGLSACGVSAFLDTQDLAPRQSVPRELVEALLSCRLVVVFLSDAYVESAYCLRELHAALTPAGTAAPPEWLLLVLDTSSNVYRCLQYVPPSLREPLWPHQSDAAATLRDVVAQLAQVTARLSERLGVARADRVRRDFLDASLLPPRVSLGGYRAILPRAVLSEARQFVGRVDLLWNLRSILVAAHTGGAGAALHGVAGVGKTTLAREYVHRHAPVDFPGGVLWVDAAGSDVDLAAQFTEMLLSIEPRANGDRSKRWDGADVRRALGHAIAAAAAAGPILYVIDNFPEPGPATLPRSVNDYCPFRAHVTVLLTSRYAAGLHDGLTSLEVPPLLACDAARMLSAGDIGAQLSDAAWTQIATWTGNLPLALDVLHAALTLHVVTPEELVAVSQARTPLAAVEQQYAAVRQHVPVDAITGVVGALSISYERLSAEQQYAARVLSHFATLPIPEEVVRQLPPDVASRDMLVSLRARSLLTGGDAETIGAMHPIVAEYLRARSTAVELRSLIMWLNVAALLFAQPEGWQTGRRLAPHVADIARRAVHVEDVNVRVGAATLAVTVSGAALAWGDPALARDIAAAAEDAAMRGDFNALAHFARRDRALALRDLHLLDDARALTEALAAEAAELFGTGSDLADSAMMDLAIILRRQGELEKARDLMLELVRRDEARDPPNANAASTLSNLLLVYEDLGDREAARALEARLSLTPPADEVHVDRCDGLSAQIVELVNASPATASLLAMVLRPLADDVNRVRDWGALVAGRVVARLNASDFVAARELINDALPVLLQKLGLDHPLPRQLRRLLAIAERHLGNNAAAVALFDAVVEQERAHVVDRRVVATMLLEYAESLIAVGRRDEALAVAAETVELAVALYGADAKEVVLPWAVRGIAAYCVGDALQAIAAWQTALKIAERELEPTDEIRTSVAANLARISTRAAVPHLYTIFSANLVHLFFRPSDALNDLQRLIRRDLRPVALRLLAPQRDGPCLCGSGRKLKHCHWPELQAG